ncbi:hypothetical protein B0H17DRAFT_1149840 [Mycena rosella]|uniref:Uncharacterized protein n=1 Tax=Mycena rosella TaxID=1033263 RepID=A0AAD7BY88_MYCRO|nr:hypothetical protein B0H17DRAFT_1149840 [Mycena rosella]
MYLDHSMQLELQKVRSISDEAGTTMLEHEVASDGRKFAKGSTIMDGELNIVSERAGLKILEVNLTILNTRAMSVKREAEGWAYDMLVEENPDGATEVIWAVSDSVGGAGAGGDGDEGCKHGQARELESGMVEAVLAWCQKNPACLEFVTPLPPEGELLVFSASLIFLRTV